MRNLKIILGSMLLAATMTSCNLNPVKPNHEGVLQTNYGRNGIEDFKAVTGSQGVLGPSEELFQVPMWEQKADPSAVEINTKNSSKFTVDPSYIYSAMRGKGRDIIFNYKHVGVTDEVISMDEIENGILNAIVVNAYKEEARKFTTDSLMNNLQAFESNVELRLKQEFAEKFFTITQLTSGLTPPKSMTDAVEDRDASIERARQAKNNLEIARMNLEKKKIEKEANLIESQGLTREVLQQQWIEAIRTSQNRIIITDGKTPVMIQ
jgi:hypothetical protein